MFRTRRGRLLILLVAVFTIVFLQLVRTSVWFADRQPEPAPAVKLEPPADVPVIPDTGKSDEKSSHGFKPEDKVQEAKEGKPSTDILVDDDEDVLFTDDDEDTDLASVIDQEPLPSKPVEVSGPKSSKQAEPGAKTSDSKRPEKGISTGETSVGVDDKEEESPPHWVKLPEHFPVDPEELIKLPSGNPRALPKLQVPLKEETATEKQRRLQQLALIKDTFVHAWEGYRDHAMGHDEVRPVSGGYRDPFAGWGATLVDALDTLWIMGLEDEFASAVEEVKKIDFTTTFREEIPLFETVIRYLGGLLGAYDVSSHQYPVLLEKAVELADVLMGAFDTPNRMPETYYRWQPAYAFKPRSAGRKVVLAELGSLSVEFTRLAQLTKNNTYYDAIARITNELEKSQKNTRLPGMWPHFVDASGCKMQKRSAKDSSKKSNGASSSNAGTTVKNTDKSKTIQKRGDSAGLAADAEPADYSQAGKTRTSSSKSATGLFSLPKCEKQGLVSPPRSKYDSFGLGGLSDSAYEYFPKEYMLLGGLEDTYRRLYETSMDVVREKLLFRPMIKEEDRDIRFIATVQIRDPNYDDEDERKRTGGGELDEEEPVKYSYEGTHLTCFAGGMFAIGSKLFGIKGDLDIAAKLTDGCVWAYESTTTGIMPEKFLVVPCEDVRSCPWDQERYYNVLDPDPDRRIQEAQAWHERQLAVIKKVNVPSPSKQLPKPKEQLKPNPADHVSEGELKKQKIEEDEAKAEILKRDVPGPERKPLPKPALEQPVHSEDSDGLLPSPSVLSHEEFAVARIREERLPPGFVDIPARSYILRPEAIESVFIMFRLTGDPSWREKGWQMFLAVSRACHTGLADSAIFDVTRKVPFQSNGMESFWLAETLKYFYLLFSDPDVISLDEYVFNTEAHPLLRPRVGNEAQ